MGMVIIMLYMSIVQIFFIFMYLSFCVCYFLLGFEFSICLVDVDGDGLKDIIIGLVIGKDISIMVMELDMDKFCRSIGKFQLFR